MITQRVKARLPAIEELLRGLFQVTLTKQAIDILGETLSAITEDPHRSWPVNITAHPEEFEDSMMDAAPSALAALATALGLRELASFDLLHGMTGLVERICPFDKPISPSG